jgi:hypothetical protein
MNTICIFVPYEYLIKNTMEFTNLHKEHKGDKHKDSKRKFVNISKISIQYQTLTLALMYLLGIMWFKI